MAAMGRGVVLRHQNPLGLPLKTAMAPKMAERAARGLPQQAAIQDVKHIVAVASGKGGVGKTTTSVNLALALAKQQLAVGLLDVDLFGPSVPRMMRLAAKPELTDDGRLRPLRNYGLQVMSMGFLVDADAPVVWRGLMVMKALEQLLRQVAWDPLDVLVIDMPPGTGDTQLTISQQVPLAGAVIVSTPQEVALAATRKGIAMFQKVHVPILGVVENMSYYQCAGCGTARRYPFGRGGARRTAEALGVPLLAEIPLEDEICATSDSGHPVVVSAPDGVPAQAYTQMAAAVWARIDGQP